MGGAGHVLWCLAAEVAEQGDHQGDQNACSDRSSNDPEKCGQKGLANCRDERKDRQKDSNPDHREDNQRPEAQDISNDDVDRLLDLSPEVVARLWAGVAGGGLHVVCKHREGVRHELSPCETD